MSLGVWPVGLARMFVRVGQFLSFRDALRVLILRFAWAAACAVKLALWVAFLL